jgi:hypothetical protein
MSARNDSLAGGPAGKRVAPPKVKPVKIGDLRFEALHWGKERGLGQNGGYVAALDARTGKELWVLRVYTIDYRDDLEEDVQDIFIESLAAGPRGTLKVVDEQRRRYTVDPATRTVRAA